MNDEKVMKVRRALISVYNKSGLGEVAGCLSRHKIEIISSGGTAKALRELGYTCIDVSEYTGYPESPGNLVKTLHPRIHGGLLLDDTNPEHLEFMQRTGIHPIDLVIINLYPFSEVASLRGVDESRVHEMIDIGGPAMVRASGKGALLHGRPCIVVDPADYPKVIDALDSHDGIPGKMVKDLAIKAFEVTAGYDASILNYLTGRRGDVHEGEPVSMSISFRFSDGGSKEVDYELRMLRSGENPHQRGYIGEPVGRRSYREVIPGRGMGLTNHLDLVGYAIAFEVRETMKYLNDPRTEVVVINKHANPAVLAAREDQCDALTAALSTDRKSPFGGTLITSSPLRVDTANSLARKNREERFILDVLAAPGFEPEAIDILTPCMKNLRIIDLSSLTSWDSICEGILGWNMKWTIGGKPVLTEMDHVTFFNSRHGMEVLSRRKPAPGELTDAYIAWIICKAVQSNSFAFVKDALLLAQCGGQPNREDSARFAWMRAQEFGVSLSGSAAATDSFIFDHTTIDLLKEMGVRTVVHPTRKHLTTGSLKPDEQILAKIDEYDMVMIRPYLLSPDNRDLPWRVFRHL